MIYNEELQKLSVRQNFIKKMSISVKSPIRSFARKLLPDICFVIMPACGHNSSSRLVRNGSIRTQDGVSFRDIMYRSLGS